METIEISLWRQVLNASQVDHNQGAGENQKHIIILNFQNHLLKTPKITQKLEKIREKNFMRKNFYETSIGFVINNKKQLTLRKGYIILEYYENLSKM